MGITDQISRQIEQNKTVNYQSMKMDKLPLHEKKDESNKE